MTSSSMASVGNLFHSPFIHRLPATSLPPPPPQHRPLSASLTSQPPDSHLQTLNIPIPVSNPNPNPNLRFSPLDAGSSRLPNSPLLLYLPGIGGSGFGLSLHHRKLGQMFDIWCLHIPAADRTPFPELVKVVESTVKFENRRFGQFSYIFQWLTVAPFDTCIRSHVKAT
ncbi:hypothetical protein L1987_52300 [Smallanthus sonchifolius]|uniref:Uncharacterized protein n=1 Tax=Smallanthus sonchifolius TaxID=185202 RepID=A0ACB9ETC8_9ASTR|nr:hypothetical protein L1987_52300 [Smallanthus sonchifolius]